MSAKKIYHDILDRGADYFSDSFDQKKRKTPPFGKVQIYERKIGGTDKKLYLIGETSNIIVYRGRHWLIQRAFNKSFNSNLKDLYIGWFAVGTGGLVGGDPYTPSQPDLKDTQLGNHAPLGSSDNIITFNDKQYHCFDGANNTSPTYPEFQADPEIDESAGDNRYLVSNIAVTLCSEEGNGTGSGGETKQFLSEAGLFVSDSRTPSPMPTVMEMFARTTFTAREKSSDNELVFNWYIFF